MKKFLVLSLVIAVSFLATSCMGIGLGFYAGGLYSSAKAPAMVTGNDLGSKVGQGQVTNVLGAICIGDGSINTVAKSAGINKVSHVDYEYFSILGLFGTQTVFVYGK